MSLLVWCFLSTKCVVLCPDIILNSFGYLYYACQVAFKAPSENKIVISVNSSCFEAKLCPSSSLSSC